MNEEITHTEQQKEKLITQILQLCEKQYRKGFQQGYYARKNGGNSTKKVDQWRIDGSIQNYVYSVDPQTGEVYEPKEIALGEMAMPGMRELERFLKGLD
jgi:hypothetical protein